MLTESQIKGIFRELSYHTSRSGGKGGQNVNKVETKVEIEWNVKDTPFLREEQKQMLYSRIAGLEENGILKVYAHNHRTQLENKNEARKKLIAQVNKALKPVKKRVGTKPTASSKRKRKEGKMKLSEKKSLRRKIE